jgi:hypothetical protein
MMLFYPQQSEKKVYKLYWEQIQLKSISLFTEYR